MSSSILRFDMVDDETAAIFRKKSTAERLAIAHGMWRMADRTIRSILRSEHSDWSDEQISREAARRLSHGAV